MSQLNRHKTTNMSLALFRNLRIILQKTFLQRSLASDLHDNQFNGKYDFVIVGGGILGVATARELSLRLGHHKIAVLEKENKLAAHQSGRNSGVIHAGIYYTPGSLKSKLCADGMRLLYKYFEDKSVPHKKVGKLIVATNAKQEKPLMDLFQRAQKNSVPGLTLVEGNDIPSIEPNCRGIKAIWSPLTGIVDYALVTEEFAKDLMENGGDILLNYEVRTFRESLDPNFPIEIHSKDGKIVNAKYVVTCGGLHSDVLAEMSGCPKYPRIVPFRGEYLILKPEKNDLVRGNIYPVPDPSLPFLGVHFTPRIDGSVWLGPNAVLAFQREGYKWTDIKLNELRDTIEYPGFRKLAFRYKEAGCKELINSFCTHLQVNELQKFVPSLKLEDVSKGPAGVRAQALDLDGNLIEDFYFDTSSEKGIMASRILHCRNAPSPGATSSLAIAKMMADKITTNYYSVT